MPFDAMLDNPRNDDQRLNAIDDLYHKTNQRAVPRVSVDTNIHCNRTDPDPSQEQLKAKQMAEIDQMKISYDKGYDEALKIVEALAMRKFGPRHPFMTVLFALRGN